MVEVTDADREAAAQAAALVEMRDLIRAGKADHLAQSFAAHREAHEAPLKARIAELDAALDDAFEQMAATFADPDRLKNSLRAMDAFAGAMERASAALKGQSDD